MGRCSSAARVAGEGIGILAECASGRIFPSPRRLLIVSVKSETAVVPPIPPLTYPPMTTTRPIHRWIYPVLAALLAASCAPVAPVKRVGMVTQLRPDKVAEYKQLHADSNAGVRDLLNKYHMHNFSIYLQKIDGKWYEFGYYEYTGSHFEEDMATMAKEPRTIEWLKVCDPMQIPLPGAKGWTEMERVYLNP